MGGDFMDEQALATHLANLNQAMHDISPLERERILALAEETERRHRRIVESIEHRRESLQDLALSVNYLVFDLEATRRENDMMRQRLEQLREMHDDESSGDEID